MVSATAGNLQIAGVVICFHAIAVVDLLAFTKLPPKQFLGDQPMLIGVPTNIGKMM